MCTRGKPPQAQKQKSNGLTTSALILLTYMTSNGGVEQKLTLREMTIAAHNAHSVDNMKWDNRSCSYHELGHNQKCKIHAIQTSGVGTSSLSTLLLGISHNYNHQNGVTDNAEAIFPPPRGTLCCLGALNWHKVCPKGAKCDRWAPQRSQMGTKGHPCDPNDAKIMVK